MQLDMATIREGLNALTFEQGTRRIALGRVSELFPEQDASAIARELAAWEGQLRRHDLALVRDAEDPELLYAVQSLKYAAVDLSWLSRGLQWVSMITTVALEMVLPAVGGIWLDRQLGTRFLGLLGLALGIPLGLWHLVRMTQPRPRPDSDANRTP